MPLTPIQTLTIILSVTAGTVLTRITPFMLFPEKRNRPAVIEYLSGVIPPAMMGLLSVYCLKSATIMSYPYGIPELISIAVLVALHLWKRNILLSIGAGTVIYMLLVQLVFV